MHWRSHRIKRVCRSTFAGATLAAVDALDQVVVASRDGQAHGAVGGATQQLDDARARLGLGERLVAAGLGRRADFDRESTFTQVETVLQEACTKR